MSAPLVDLSIAVHAAERPIARAVGSVLEGTTGSVRVTVIAHNIDASIIRDRLGALADDPRVRLLALADGIPSPAGPLNLGLESAEAPFSSVMGSDDTLEPGAIDSWLALQAASGAAAVLARVQAAGGSTVPSPPARPGRSTGIDGVRDRLSYRSAPLGIVSREHFGDLRFAEGLRSGEDIAYVTRIWYSGLPLAFDRTGPAYLVHTDAGDRVTSDARPVREDFGFLEGILGEGWFIQLSRAAKEAFVVAVLRGHLFDAVLNRSRSTEWPVGERDALATVARRLLAASPGAERLVSLADRAALDAVLDTASETHDVIRLIARRSVYLHPRAVLTRNPLLALRAQAPFRTLAAGYLLQRAGR